MGTALEWLSFLKNITYLSKENETIEFKKNNADPEMIGRDISALSNMAALLNQDKAYLVWGVDDSTHELIGTSFSFLEGKVGNESLTNWLASQLYPHIYFTAHEFTYDEKKFVVLEIAPALTYITRFKSDAYCRIDSYTKPLKSYPSVEKEIWGSLEKASPEEKIVISNLNEAEVGELLSIESYFRALGVPQPGNRKEALDILAKEGFIRLEMDGTYSILMLGALLLAFDLRRFSLLGRKGIIVTLFDGDMKIQNKASEEFVEGYLLSFEKAISYIKTLTLLKTNVNEKGFTVSEYAYPEIALREALTNSIIHQNILERGSCIMVNIVDNSIEFLNPGSLQVNPDHLIDALPMSVNEKLSSFLRRVGIGDSRGTGFDKMFFALENAHMAPLKIRDQAGFVSLSFDRYKPFSEWSHDERVEAVYYHACLRYYSSSSALTNESLRLRLSLKEKDKSLVSRLIKEAVEEGRIKAKNPLASDRYKEYVPYWA